MTSNPDASLPVVAAGRRRAGLGRRIGQVIVAGIVIAAAMGLVEAVLLCMLRRMPEPLLVIREAVLGYAVLGAVVGAAWGTAVELISPRRGRWRRTPFYLLSLFLLILLFQLVLHTHLHWTGGRLPPGSARSLKVTALEALPAVLIIGVLWLACLKARPPASLGPIIGLRPAGVLLAVMIVVTTAGPWVAGLLRPAGAIGVPNVLLIVLDTTRVDRLSAFGYDRPTTPALERRAADGLLFTKAYAAAPWTLPSHASMFTGEYPTVHNANWEHQFLDDRLPTLAEHLSEQGLRTAAFARQVWLSEETGLMRGFEDFYDLYWRSSTALVATWRLGVELYNVRRHTKDKGAAIVTAKFKSWIDRHGKRPFFAFINYLEPHDYYEPPTPFRERFLSETNADTPWGREKTVAVQKYNAGVIEYGPEELSAFSDLYDGAVAYQDSRMGEALDHLRARGLLDNTLVIITADHGENLGDHGLLGHEFCVYETLVHVPLVVRLPGTVPAGRVDDVVENRRLWSLIDTVLWESEDIPMPAETVVTALRDSDQAVTAAFAELYKRPLLTPVWKDSPRLGRFDRRMRCLRIEDMKYIWASDDTNELYDIARDPQELVNLASVRPEDLAALRELLLARVAALGTPDATDVPEFSDELQRRLKSLGYLD